MNKKNLGFTLIELMVSITIVAILSVAVTALYMNALKKSRNSKRESDLETIRQALVMYKADDGCYPDSSTTSIYSGVLTGYVESVPTEPSGVQYSYSSSGTCSSGSSNFTLTATEYEDGSYSVDNL